MNRCPHCQSIDLEIFTDARTPTLTLAKCRSCGRAAFREGDSDFKEPVAYPDVFDPEVTASPEFRDFIKQVKGEGGGEDTIDCAELGIRLIDLDAPLPPNYDALIEHHLKTYKAERGHL